MKGAQTVPLSLPVWLVVCGILFVIAPNPPPVGPRPGDAATFARKLQDTYVQAQRWHAVLGDRVIPWEQARGHLAIVIDDVGHELHLHHKLQGLRAQLTFSVLPGATYVAGAQLRLQEDRRRERTVMLHLPCEPLDGSHMTRTPGERAQEFLLASDSPQQLRDKLRRALDRVPLAVGVNNHMGSRLTADPEAMAALMPVLRERGLFFLDSITTADSRAAEQARAAGVPTLERHLFLDHDPRPQAIAEQLERAAERALREPTIVIAHPSEEVVRVLREVLPDLHARQIGIFSLREFAERQTQWESPAKRSESR